MKARRAPCGSEIANGRLEKAEQFYSAAQDIRDLAIEEADIADAYVTLCVHAGIAAADAICCTELREHAKGESHHEAVVLIKSVRPDGTTLANSLTALLRFKSRAGYSAMPVNADMLRRSKAAAERLLTAARDRVAR